MTDSTKTQVVVIGGGPAGYAAAFKAADLGLDVTLVELEENPGGTCLYRGCIPSKALLHVARVINESREAEYFGIHYEAPRIDLDRLREATVGIVNQLTGGLGQLGRARKLTYIQGRAGFLDSNTLRIHLEEGGEQDLHFENAIVATGSRPTVIPHLMLETDRVMTSTDALELRDIPERLLAIGGGYIGLELATVYAALGSKVTVVEMMPTLLPGADKDLVKPLAKRMASACEAIHLEAKVEKLEDKGDHIQATMSGPTIEEGVQDFDRVLVSVGRKPNSSGIGLDNTKVVVNEQGFIEVDKQLRTADPHIFAIGDLVGQPMLAHKGTREGIIAAEVISGKKSVFEPQCIPAVVFTDPEVAWAGITETEAKDRDLAIEVARFPWAASGRATTLNRGEGLTKIIVDSESGQVLGVAMVGVGAGEMIAEGALAIEMGALASDIALTIHPHPTLSETLMEAAELLHGSSTHMYRPQRKK